jgi:Fur family transcriptional regulator, ferric uptake regulator
MAEHGDNPEKERVLAAILSAFTRAGMRRTRQRSRIAQALARLARKGATFSTEDLWLNLRREDATMGRATVYRAVDLLLEAGVLDRVVLPDGSSTHRVCGGAHHHHVTCTGCNRTVSIDACLPGEVLAAVSRTTEFVIDGHALELYGRCPSCRSMGTDAGV